MSHPFLYELVTIDGGIYPMSKNTFQLLLFSNLMPA